MAQQALIIRNQGLHTNNNLFSATPNGSMSEAVNVVINKSEVVEPRRGLYTYTTLSAVNALLSYKSKILSHSATKLSYDLDNLGNFVDILGNTDGRNLIDPDATSPIRSVEANGNLYLTSGYGIQKISARNSDDLATINIEDAGGVKGTSLSIVLDFSQTGFLTLNSKVAYRLVFGRTDLNENLLLGAPTPIANIYNSSSALSCITNLSFDIPTGIRANDFYQIYRTGLSSAIYPIVPSDAGDEMYLVLENTITAADIVNGTIGVLAALLDISPDDFRKNGTLLYTNPVSGEGITQANDSPPLAKDICQYKGFIFLANTQTKSLLNLSVVSVSSLVSNTTNLILNKIGTGILKTFLFQGATEAFTINYNVCIPADFIAAAATSAYYFKLHSSSTERKYYVWFYDAVNLQTDPALSGYIGIKVTVAAADTTDSKMTAANAAITAATTDFNLNLNTTTNILVATCANNGFVTALTGTTKTVVNMTWAQNGLGTGEDLTAGNGKIFLPRYPTGSENGPTVSQQLEQVGKSIARVITRNSTYLNAYYISNSNDIPGQLLLEEKKLDSASYNVYYLTSNATLTSFNPKIPVSSADTSVLLTAEIKPNRLYYSKHQQPDSFPLVNYLDIGPKDKAIKRIIPIRDALFILKENGIYKLTGDTAVAGNNNFNLVEFDFSVQVLAASTAVVLNNQIYALSTQGVIVINDTLVSVISRPIEDKIQQILKAGTNYAQSSFGLAYETDRSYSLFANTTSGNTTYRYNTFTNTWTTSTIGGYCGLINPADDTMYLGNGTLISKERKSLDRTDFADKEYTTQILLSGVNTTTGEVSVSSLTNIKTGDVIVQEQYVTIADFNRILVKLDNDIGVTDSDYYSTLAVSAGMNLRTKLEALATKLDADAGVTATNYSSSIANIALSAITDISIDTVYLGNNYSVLTIGTSTPLSVVVDVNTYTRYISITGSNSIPSIDGTYHLAVDTATKISILKKIRTAGTTGNYIIDINSSQDISVCLSIIVNKLNIDSVLGYTNYPYPRYTQIETLITNVNKITTIATVSPIQNLLYGNMVIYNAIDSYVVYNPQFFGDPSIEKQVSEGTLMFQDLNFSTMIVAYSTDKHPSFEAITFTKKGSGDFGSISFGESYFGGTSAPVPLRTYIPVAKQRCRFINVKVQHTVALEQYELHGVSLSFRPYNKRAYT